MDPTRKMLGLLNFASSAYLPSYMSSSIERRESIKKKGLRGKDWSKRKKARNQAKKSKKQNKN